jgi:AraC family transcriptional regulator
LLPQNDNIPQAMKAYLPQGPGSNGSSAVRRVDAAGVTAMVVDFYRASATAGDWYSEDIHYFDVCLGRRPHSAYGQFPDLFNESLRLGQVFLAPAGVRFAASGPQGRQHSLYVFLRQDALFSEEKAIGASLATASERCLRLQCPPLQPIFRRISSEVHNPGLASGIMLEGLALTLMAEYFRHAENSRIESLRGGMSAWRMRRIEERVLDGDAPPTLSELASLCGLSRRQLMRAFREETGRTVGDYVRDCILARAQSLLVNTDKPLGVIASSLGFATPSAFSAAFRKATGQAPSQFRSIARA